MCPEAIVCIFFYVRIGHDKTKKKTVFLSTKIFSFCSHGIIFDLFSAFEDVNVILKSTYI